MMIETNTDTERFPYSPSCFDADYYPYGAEVYEYASSCSTNYKFTGKERDGKCELNYFGARYLSSPYGRFMTPAPLGPAEMIVRLTPAGGWSTVCAMEG